MTLNARVQLTRFEKGQRDRGDAARQLSKTLSLGADGKLIKDGSACRMAYGSAERRIYAAPTAQAVLEAFGNDLIETAPHEAWALGRLDPSLRDRVGVVTKSQETPDQGTISRSRGHLQFAADNPALMLFDVDTHGMPVALRQVITAAGGIWPAVATALPSLATSARLERASTSAGLRNKITGEDLPAGDGMHIYMAVTDGADIPRALAVMVDRLTLVGLGWCIPSAAGAALHRTLVDGAVSGPERLIFEGRPKVLPPLIQLDEARIPTLHAGEWLDTRVALPDLTPDEKLALARIRRENEAAIADTLSSTRSAYIRRAAAQLVEAGASEIDARARIEQRIDAGRLREDDVLDFDDAGPKSVQDLLASPELMAALDGCSMADPIEPERGRNKAVFYAKSRVNGLPLIHSLIRGGTNFHPRHTTVSLKHAQALATATGRDAGSITVEAIAAGLAQLSEAEIDGALQDAARLDLPHAPKVDIRTRVAALRRELKSRRAERDRDAARAFADEGEDVPAADENGIPRGFHLTPRGWIFAAGEDAFPLHFAGPFTIAGRVSDAKGEGHGLLLRWADTDNRPHAWLMPRAMLAGDPAVIAASMLERGLLVLPGLKERAALVRLLILAAPRHAALLVRRTGFAA